MLFEIHLTVQNIGILKFIDDCKEFGLKPILIEIENNSIIVEQLMTSFKDERYHYFPSLVKQRNFLLSLGYTILREKVEIKPGLKKHSEHTYYESHLRLKLPKNFNRTILELFSQKNDLHLSKNLFKRDEFFDFQMITYRKNDMDIDSFINQIEKFKNDLDRLNIIYDKIEIEECVYDSNISVDNSWLK